MFGLIEQRQDDELRVSIRAEAIIAPVEEVDAERAKLGAFFDVELFKRLFDQFDGRQLPEPVGLSNLLRNQYRVVPGRVDATVKVMLDSAEQAGLFKVSGNRSRMVMPIPTARSDDHQQPPKPPAKDESKARNRGGGGDDGSGTHPWILGILRELPEPGTPMSRKRRDALIGAFTATVGLIYPEADDESGTG